MTFSTNHLFRFPASSKRRQFASRLRQLIIERFEQRELLAADFEPIKILNSDSLSSSPGQFTQVGSQLFFQASNELGVELWKTDGTVAGTVMVKDIATGPFSSVPANMAAVGGTLFFTARTVATGYELWKSDGTEAGTVLVKDILTGATGSSPSLLTNVSGTLFFVANDNVNGRELWKSDGTTAGTVLVRDIRPGSFSSNVSGAVNLAGTLIFSANDGTNGYEVWKSDGTNGGTSLITNISPGAGNANVGNLTLANNSVFFSANDGTNGIELWKTGGTPASTFLVKNILSGANSSYPSSLVNVNNVLFFSAADAIGNTELWKSDGSLAGTVLVRDIVPSGSSAPYRLTNVNGILYFNALDPIIGRELWKSDGTLAGTLLVKDLNPGVSGSYVDAITPFSGGLVFVASDASGPALWRSDGTNAGTEVLKHANPVTNASIGNLFPFLGSLYFMTNDGTHGFELWKSDGTAIGTTMFKDINASYYGSNPARLDVVNGKLFYSAFTPELGRELWVTDGTAAGTELIMDINPGAVGGSIYNPVNVNGTLYFRADDGTSGSELWRSDGTHAGTFRVKDIAPGISGSAPSYLTNLNGNLAFVASDTTNGRELWISDGTSSGTRLVKDINPGIANSSIFSLLNFNGTLFFAAVNATNGSELWRSDGTTTNTVMIKDIRSGGGSYPNGMTIHNGKMYFRANDGVLGSELWVSDGTSTGTTLLADIFSGANSSYPTNFISVGSQLFFVATDNTSGNELWKTDGTAIGTVLVKDIAVGTSNSSVSNFTNVNGSLYFAANDQVAGTELWKSDGTNSGTIQVKEIAPGVASSFPNSLINFNGQLVFAANDGNGLRAWTSDGSSVGTVPLLSAGSTFANFTSLANLNGQLVAFGREVLQVTQNVKVDLSTSTTDRTIVLRKASNGIEVFDQTNATQLAFLTSVALSSVQQLTIIGSASANETITVDYQSGGFFRLPGGLTINAGSSSGDSLSIVGTLSQQLTWQSQSTVQSATFGVQQSGSSSIGNIDGLETITTSGFLSATVNGLLQAGPPNMLFNNPGTLNLGQTTQLGGGTLSSSSLVSLGAGEVLTGSGSVQGRFNAELGSLILPTGNLSIGLSSSTTGFNTRGDLIVDQYSVSLLDANEAVLGSLTTLGNGATPGSLTASSGLLVDFGNNVSGFGTINTPNVASKPFTMNGSIVGNSSGNPITLTGFVKGVGNLTNVSIAGTYSPGFSPAAVTVGSMTYAPTATTIVELGGNSAGTGYDQINHVGTAALGGTLNVQLINSFVPTVGSSFTIMTATGGFTGSFATQILPTAPLGSGWNLVIGTNSMQLQLVDLANVQTAQLGNGAPQRSRIDQVVVTFQGPVDIDAGAFAILKRGVSGGPVTSGFTTSVNGSGDTVATISFSGAFTRAGGALVDGYYQLTIDNTKVRRAGTTLNLDGDNNGLAGGDFVRGTTATDNFFAYYGDTDGDGAVGVAEFGQFRTSFGKLPSDPGYNVLFDFDGAGVGVADFGQFRSRFGRSIAFE